MNCMKTKCKILRQNIVGEADTLKTKCYYTYIVTQHIEYKKFLPGSAYRNPTGGMGTSFPATTRKLIFLAESCLRYGLQGEVD